MGVVALCEPGGPARPSDHPAAEFVRAWDHLSVRYARRQACFRGVAADADDFAQEARIRVAALPESRRAAPYVRKTIFNAVLAAGLGAPDLTVLDSIDSHAEDLVSEETSVDIYLVDAVAQWIGGLPPKLRMTFRLLYVEGYSQSEAAVILGVSQPRVAQLHRALLDLGRTSLAPYGAAA